MVAQQPGFLSQQLGITGLKGFARGEKIVIKPRGLPRLDDSQCTDSYKKNNAYQKFGHGIENTI